MADQPVKLIADVEHAELACRCLEAAGKFKRPEGLTAVQFISSLQLQDRERWRRVASTVIKYFKETSVRADTLTEVTANLISTIDLAELACRCIESASAGEFQRAKGLTAAQAISNLQSEDQIKWLAVAHDAAKYISECAEKAQRLQ